jgi:hypothetical protein
MSTPLEWLTDIASADINACSSDKKNRFIATAQNEVDSSVFQSNDKYNMAIAYYAAHLLALSLRDDNSRGVLTSEKEGDLQRSYGGNFSNSEMNTTQYLDSFNRLLESRVPTFYMQDGSKSSR